MESKVEFNITTDFMLHGNITITNEPEKLININNFIKIQSYNDINFKTYLQNVYYHYEYESKIPDSFNDNDIFKLIRYFFQFEGFWLPYRPLKDDKINFEDLPYFIKEKWFQKFLIFLLNEEYITDTDTGFIIQDEPMKIDDIYVTKNGFWIVLKHWNSK